MGQSSGRHQSQFESRLPATSDRQFGSAPKKPARAPNSSVVMLVPVTPFQAAGRKTTPARRSRIGRDSTSLTSISAVSVPMPTTRTSSRTMACDRLSGCSSNRCRRASSICLIWPIGIVNLSGRGMLLVSVARQLGSGNPFARLLCCPAQAEPGRKEAPSVR